MFHSPGNHSDLSLKLSEVFDDIGMNETMVMKGRQAILLNEAMKSITYKSVEKQSMFCFGSQSEGTTTMDLNSDTDSLLCNHDINVIQDFSEWQPGLTNLLMIQNDSTSPGYCQLQLTRPDLPLPVTKALNKYHAKVSRDTVILKNTIIRSTYTEGHGPAWVMRGRDDERDMDIVQAFHCKSWPREARPWLQRGAGNYWPTPEIKKFPERSGCFVVPVGSKFSQNEALEWRISTSLAERGLMFSLNITQIRCYILMKMILKTYLTSQGEGHLSSFMCKTVLMYCVENTHPNEWKEHNLWKCLLLCLQRLHTSLMERNCPHFIIPGNNLMTGNIPLQVKHKLQDTLCHIMQSNGSALFGIEIDDLGKRLQIKLNVLSHPVPSLYAHEPLSLISLANVFDTTRTICVLHRYLLQQIPNAMSKVLQQSLFQYIRNYTTIYRDGSELEQIASSVLVLPICSTLGTVTASINLQTKNNIGLPPEAADWLHAGLNSDVSSGRLKQASVFYCLGDMVRTDAILQEITRRYNRNAVEPACGCHNFPRIGRKIEFAEDARFKDIVRVVRENVSFCVKFTRAEINCTPHELQYEMFRSTKMDMLHRDTSEVHWMDWATVDSLPFLHFLQYKTYGQLQRRSDQQRALNDLIVTIETETNLRHRETALNILGQCFEKENRYQDALNSYVRSLNVKQKNNAAGLHICRLLAKIVNNARD